MLFPMKKNQVYLALKNMGRQNSFKMQDFSKVDSGICRR